MGRGDFSSQHYRMWSNGGEEWMTAFFKRNSFLKKNVAKFDFGGEKNTEDNEHLLHMLQFSIFYAACFLGWHYLIPWGGAGSGRARFFRSKRSVQQEEMLVTLENAVENEVMRRYGLREEENFQQDGGSHTLPGVDERLSGTRNAVDACCAKERLNSTSCTSEENDSSTTATLGGPLATKCTASVFGAPGATSSSTEDGSFGDTWFQQQLEKQRHQRMLDEESEDEEVSSAEGSEKGDDAEQDNMSPCKRRDRSPKQSPSRRRNQTGNSSSLSPPVEKGRGRNHKEADQVQTASSADYPVLEWKHILQDIKEGNGYYDPATGGGNSGSGKNQKIAGGAGAEVEMIEEQFFAAGNDSHSSVMNADEDEEID
ncbi:unnamed protein product [Amoebophrya sp. A120]|nr:unnamed protein product [Amoebophrya sp. A120]|eukprot:GSA120T00013682001.1